MHCQRENLQIVVIDPSHTIAISNCVIVHALKYKMLDIFRQKVPELFIYYH